MDKTTASGMRPEVVASRVVQSVVCGNADVTIAMLLHRTVIYLRTLSPNLYFHIMNKRARKQRQELLKQTNT